MIRHSKSVIKENLSEAQYLTFQPYRLSPSWLNRLTEFFSKNKETELTENLSQNANLIFDYEFDVAKNEAEHNEASFKQSQNFFQQLEKSNQKSLNETSSLTSSLNLSTNKNFNSLLVDPYFEHNEYDNELIEKLGKSRNETEALRILEQMWHESKFCDLIIVVENNEYLAHRVVLAFYSERFKNYFERHKYDFVSRVTLAETSTAAIQKILHYIYTNQLSISIKTIESVIVCAKELDMKKLTDMCELSLLKFEKKHVLQVLQISRKCKLKTAYYHAYWYICTNFNQCIKLNYFTKLSVSVILELVENNTIINRDETLLFDRVMAWIGANSKSKPNERAVQLLKVVDFGKVNIHDFDSILNENKYILSVPECLQLLREKIRLFYDKSKLESRLRTRSALVPRHGFDSVYTENDQLSFYETKKMQILSKIAENPEQTTTKTMKNTSKKLSVKKKPSMQRNRSISFDLDKPNLKELAKKKSNSLVHRRISLKDSHVVSSILKNTNKFQSFDELSDDEKNFQVCTVRKHWKKETQLFMPMDSYIVISGGFVRDMRNFKNDKFGGLTSGSNGLLSFAAQNYCYSLIVKKWITIASFKEPKAFFGCTVLNNQIWVVGGQNASEDLLGQIEFYDVNNDVWTALKRLKKPRMCSNLVNHNNKLMIIGGYSNSQTESILKTFTCYDMATKSWFKKNPIEEPAINGAVVKCMDKLYFVGGIKINQEPSIDVYDEQNDKWKKLYKLNEKLEEACVEVIGSKIYIIGGVDSETFKTSRKILIFDALTLKLDYCRKLLFNKLEGAASCVIYNCYKFL